LAELVPGIPYAAILSAADVAKMLDPLGADTDSSPDFRMSARRSLLVPESRLSVGKGVMQDNNLGETNFVFWLSLCEFD
jgi:hypothetical protein